MKSINKIKQAMKRYTEKLILIEKEVDNIDVNIYHFNNMIIEDMDVKQKLSYIVKYNKVIVLIYYKT